jgi:molybdate transport system substrate-binding protein
LAGCGQAGDGADSTALTVSAAASLSEAFDAYGELVPGTERFSFAGSDTLAAQIRQGAEPDVFASASPVYPRELAAEGLVGEPIIFARNRLVIAVPADSSIESIDDLARPGLDLVLGAEGVPAGDYARRALAGLPQPERVAILANVRSEESDVKGVLGKVAQGAADAGFVYSTDVTAGPVGLRAVEVPPPLAPRVAYVIAIGSETADRGRARAFVDGLLAGAGAEALAEAGFEPAR